MQDLSNLKSEYALQVYEMFKSQTYLFDSCIYSEPAINQKSLDIELLKHNIDINETT